MSVFIPNIPAPGDNLDFSQAQLLSNNQGLDTVFGIDHYAFSNATSNKGFHNTVTQPLIVGAAHPTTVADPKIYAMQDSASLGVLQYSRGPNNSVPTPLTSKNSPAAPIVLAGGTTTNIMDFTGISQAFAMLYAGDVVAGGTAKLVSYIIWNGTTFVASPLSFFNMGTVASGNILQLRYTFLGPTLNNVYWTLQFLRIQ